MGSPYQNPRSLLLVMSWQMGYFIGHGHSGGPGLPWAALIGALKVEVEPFLVDVFCSMR